MLSKFSRSGAFTSYYDGSWGYVSYPSITISSRGRNKTIEYSWREERWRSSEQRPLRWIATRRDAKFGSNIKESKICLCGRLSRKSSGAVEPKERVGLPWWLSGKASVCNAGDMGPIPGLERSLEKEMATHSSILAQEIPWTEESGGLQSMWLQKNLTTCWLKHTKPIVLYIFSNLLFPALYFFKLSPYANM